MKLVRHQAAEIALLKATDAFRKTSPCAAAALACGVKASAADTFAQASEWSKTKVNNTRVVADNDSNDGKLFWFQSGDWKRNLSFIMCRLACQGLTQECAHNHMCPLWFGADSGLATALTSAGAGAAEAAAATDRSLQISGVQSEHQRVVRRPGSSCFDLQLVAVS